MHKVLWAHEVHKPWILDPSHSRNKRVQNPLYNIEGYYQTQEIDLQPSEEKKN